MDSGALLDLLGNENRRRILQLLSRKPCYVTEISDYIGVSPKAVIDHLQRLEEAGLVESRVDDRRRKYFHIARNVRLEVNVSPYDFGVKSAYPASTSFDLNSCHRLSVHVDPREGSDGDGDGNTIPELAEELDALDDLQRELSIAQRWVHGRVAEIQEELSDAFDDGEEGHLRADVLAAVAGGASDADDVAARTGIPGHVVRSVLADLAERGAVTRSRDEWRIRDRG